jgi:CheY-like chemotaxis protein
MQAVLVVDDDEDTRFTLRMQLEDQGYAVLEADNGASALQVLQEHPEALVVLLDHLMPVMSGAELLQLVAEDHSLLQRHVYVELTAAPPRVFSPDFLALLAAMHIPVVGKPFELETLLDLVAEQVERLQRQDLPSHPGPSTDDDTGGAGP